MLLTDDECSKTAPIRAAAGKKVHEFEWNACNVDGRTERQFCSLIYMYRLGTYTEALRGFKSRAKRGF